MASEPVRATLLDPRRPARDLLEHLLDGIASCRLLFTEYADDEPEAQRSVRGETASGAAEPEESEFVCWFGRRPSSQATG